MKTSRSETLRERITSFLKRLLDEHKVAAVLVTKPYPDDGNAAPVLVSDPSLLDGADPFIPVQMVNTARMLAEISREPISGKIAAVLRPCEIRAAVELIKLRQVCRGNLYLIGYDCPGVFNLKEYRLRLENGENMEAAAEGRLGDFLDGNDAGIRSSCRLCTDFTGTSADVSLGWIGTDPPSLFIEANTAAGTELLDGLEGSEPPPSAPERDALLEAIKRRRAAGEKEAIEEFMAVLKRCIRCYNCREVCPICYCKECLLKPEKMGYSSERYLARAGKKGQIKLPVDTVLFHLTKMNHMATSCVSCGVCEQACPMDIPLGEIYNVISRQVQAQFEYRAGRSLDDELPVTTFREEELPDVED